MVESANNVQTTDWQHLTMIWSTGNEISLYIDGVLDIHTFSDGPADGTTTSATTLFIGRGGKDTGSSWLGLIDEVLFYSRALGQEEIEELASDGLPAAVESYGKLANLWGAIKQQ